VIVVDGTTRHQRILRGRLGDLPRLKSKIEPGRPVLIIVGDVVALHEGGTDLRSGAPLRTRLRQSVRGASRY